jgi:hypothetical protein
MNSRRRKNRTFLIRFWLVGSVGALSLLILACASFFLTSIYWQGSYEEARFELRFLDSKGAPLTHVRLKVENDAGGDAMFFPVTDFSPFRLIESNEHGVIAFHHVASGAEVGGKCWQLFFIFDVGECRRPVYRCRFFQADRLLFDLPYERLDEFARKSTLRFSQTWHWKEEELRSLPYVQPGRTEASPHKEVLNFVLVKKTIKDGHILDDD